jgi:hypothetical protein
MGSSKFTGRRRSPALAVEVLEGRALLTTVPSGVALQVEPTGLTTASATAMGSNHQAHPTGANVGDTLKLGRQYTKVLFSSSTATVISDYTKALLSGNTRELKRLGTSSAVRQTNAKFENAAHSSSGSSISYSFDKFGHRVSHEFYKIFG